MVLHHLDHCASVGQLLIFLAKIAYPDRLSPLHSAFIRKDLFCQYLQQRRFPAAVWSDDPDPVVFQERVGKVPEKALVPVALSQMPHFDGLISHSGRERFQEHISLLGDLLSVPKRLETLDVRFLLGRSRPRPAHYPREILLVEGRHLSLRG